MRAIKFFYACLVFVLAWAPTAYADSPPGLKPHSAPHYTVLAGDFLYRTLQGKDGAGNRLERTNVATGAREVIFSAPTGFWILEEIVATDRELILVVGKSGFPARVEHYEQRIVLLDQQTLATRELLTFREEVRSQPYFYCGESLEGVAASPFGGFTTVSQYHPNPVDSLGNCPPGELKESGHTTRFARSFDSFGNLIGLRNLPTWSRDTELSVVSADGKWFLQRGYRRWRATELSSGASSVRAEAEIDTVEPMFTSQGALLTTRVRPTRRNRYRSQVIFYAPPLSRRPRVLANFDGREPGPFRACGANVVFTAGRTGQRLMVFRPGESHPRLLAAAASRRTFEYITCDAGTVVAWDRDRTRYWKFKNMRGFRIPLPPAA